MGHIADAKTKEGAKMKIDAYNQNGLNKEESEGGQ